MRMLRLLVHRVRSLLFGGSQDAEAREELRDHLDRQIQWHLSQGTTPAEARRQAAVDVGGLAQLEEDCRDARGLAWWDALRGDARYALRQMRRSPGFSAAAVLTVALGVGATSTVFAVVDALLLRPLPYPESDRLYAVYEVNTRGTVGRTRAAALNVLDWREQSHTLALAAHAATGFTLTGRGEPEMVSGLLVTFDLLDVLQVAPAIGRPFLPHESEAGRNRVVILTHRLWQQYFGGDPSIVGAHTTVNGIPYEVIGVMPASFTYPAARYQLLTPLVTSGTVPDGPPINRYARYVTAIARLAPGTAESMAREELDTIGRRLSEAYPESNETVAIGMTPLAADVVGDTKDGLLVALTSVAVVLLVACVNVAGLALARGSARGRELGVRAALGAGRGRLVRQLTTEGLVLFVVGGGVGLTLAAWVLTTLAARLPDTLPRVAEVGIDWRFLAFGAVLTTLCGVMFSVLPALSIARQGTALEPAASRGTVSVGRRTQRVRGLLIVAQVAAAIVLLTAAGLAVRSLGEVSRAEAGFDRAGAMTFNFVMRDNRFPTAPDMQAFTTRVWESIEAVPGVLAAGITTALPLSGQNVENAFTVDGSPTPPEDGSPIAGLRGVSGHYAAALGTRVLPGRDIRSSDTADSQPVVLVTADFVARYVRQADPIGVRLKMPGADEPWRTIVGVIPAIRHNALDELPRPEVWLPFAQMPADFVTQWARGAYVVARTTPEPESVMPAIRSQIRLLDAELPLMAVTSLDDLLRQSTSERRLETSLLTAFASIALVLAAVGLFGVLAFYVAQHVPEFGVRLALGATPAALLALVLRRGIVLLVGGVAIGLPGALAMGRGMSRLLYGVEPTDPAALVAAVTILAAVMLAACALPALRAMRTDPLTALRSE